MPTKDLVKLEADATNPRSKEAVSRLIEIQKLMAKEGYDRFISFDLSMLSKYHYYTGIIFNAYTYGVGNPIVKGGRYDHLIEKFGKEAPSVGCVFQIDEIQTAIRRSGLDCAEHMPEKKVLIYNESQYEIALKTAMELRSQGVIAELVVKNPEISKEEYEERYNASGALCLFFI